MKKAFYITTTLPYINSDPHIGFALELAQADVIARFKRLSGYKVFFNTGTDEHGLKIYKKAQEVEKDPKTFADEYVVKFEKLQSALNASVTNFIRTTDPHHVAAAQEFWKRCDKNGAIYKKEYKIKYCIGCELEKTNSDLVKGRCPLHPQQDLEIIEEENYFFRFSEYQEKLLDLYDKNPLFVVPNFRLKEIRNFVSAGLEDFSISRLKSKLPWGVGVPNDPDHVMYVWFDALINYISTLGWPQDETKFKTSWPGVQIAGKDNLRQQSAMWQAMLMAAGLPTSKQIIIHGFITSQGQKMSKSYGNATDPFDLVKRYGTDAVRYYLLREIPTFDDGDYSEFRMQELYTSDLANELGNLLSRVTTLAHEDQISSNTNTSANIYSEEIATLFEKYELALVLERIWKEIRNLNKNLDEFAPWKKEKSARKAFLIETLTSLNNIGKQLLPFLPQSAEKIIENTQGKIKKSSPLFPRS